MIRRVMFILLAAACLCPHVSTALALVAGLGFSLTIGNPYPKSTSVWSKRLLQLSVVGLGFGLSLGAVWEAGRDAIFLTLASITLTIAVGRWIGKALGTPDNTSALLSFGTAICGGSAIAAMAPIIQADDDEIAVSLATVFSLNAVALLLFPPLGHFFELTETQFGTWSALAIHDTSSVVGATALYGTTALAVGTTVKLARAAWIMPVAAFSAWRRKQGGKVRLPLFIPGFIAAAALHSFMPQGEALWALFSSVARQGLVLTLFLIGASLSRQMLRNVGSRALTQGVLLWTLVSITSLSLVLGGWVN